MTHSTIYCTLHKDDDIYINLKYKEWSGPFIVFPRMMPAVSCCWQVSSRYTNLKVCHVLLHVACSWSQRGIEIFLQTVICSTCCKVRYQAPGSAAVLEGQDSKTSVQNANWYSRLAQRVHYIHHLHRYKWYILLWENFFVIHHYRTVTMIILGP
jgi:hypothetical protein